MAIGFSSSFKDDNPGDSSYWDGHNIGYTNGKLAGFNEGIDAAKKLISGSPLLDGTLTEELYQQLEKLKWK